jgi:hypothetical protein
VEQDVNKTLYQGGNLTLTDDVTVDADIYTLTIKGNLYFEGEDAFATVDVTDDLQAQITALEARIVALETAP